VAGKVLYALNVLDTVGILSIADKVKPYLPAVPMAAPATQPQPEEVHASPASLKAKVVDLEAEVNDFIASIKSQTGTGSEVKISNDPESAQSPASATPIEQLERLAQLVSEAMGKIDRVLRFPEASAASDEIPLLERLRLRALNEGELGDLMEEGRIYGSTVEPSPSLSWRETLAPAISQIVSQLASVLNTFGNGAIETAATAYQLARNNPVTTATVGGVTLVGAGTYLAGLGAYYLFFKEQLPEQPPADIEPGNAPLPLENDAALTQEQIDDQLKSDEGTTVVTQPPVVSTPPAIPTTAGLNTTVDTTVTTEPGEVPTPIESTTLPQEQIDEGTTVETVEAVSDDLPVLETAESHQQRIDDEIERIVDTPLAKGLPSLLESIMPLALEYDYGNQEDKNVLLHEIVVLLQQHNIEHPTKSYIELIQEVQAANLTPVSAGQPLDSGQGSSRIVKRDTEYANTNTDSVGNSRVADVDENVSDDEAELVAYLRTMDQLQRPDAGADQGIDDDTQVDSQTDVAMQVVRALRNRRSAFWTENSRVNGDKQVVTTYTKALVESVDSPSGYTDVTINIAPHSTFGRGWSNYEAAFKNPFFLAWAKEQHLDLKTVQLHTDLETISGMVSGKGRVMFTLADNTGWVNVAGPILRAAEAINPHFHTIPYPSVQGSSSKAPLNLVAAFYGEDLPTSKTAAEQRARELNANAVFFPINVDDPIRPLDLRSEAVLKSQKQHIRDLYARHTLVTILNDGIEGKNDNDPVVLNSFVSDLHGTSFAAKFPAELDGGVTAQRYISAMGWIVPKTVAEVRNMAQVLSSAIPESPKTGNFWGALANPRPLTTSQRNTIISETVSLLGDREVSGLLDFFLRGQSVTSPAQGLQLALDSASAKSFGRQLEVKLEAISTPGSTAEWAMAALLLDIDPALGEKRNHVAGYDLTKDTNWDKKPSEVVADLQRHLTDGGKVHARTAPVAAHHLLSGVAPEFLVKGIPDNLVCGSATWAMLRLSVARIELMAKGASAKMSFEDVMQYGALLPVTVGEDIAVRALSEPPLVDWAIANGVIAKNVSGTYSPSQITIAREKFQEIRKGLDEARSYSQAPVPTLEGFARADLITLFGPDVSLETASIIEKRDRKETYTAPPLTTSLLDAHMSGLLQSGKWESLDPTIDFAAMESKFKDLENVIDLFNLAFTEYFYNLQKGSVWALKNLFSQLSSEDLKNLEYGTQTFYSVREAVDTQFSKLTTEMKGEKKGFHGLLIRSEYKGEIIYLEVFPDSSQIRKNSLLPNTLTVGGVVDPTIGLKFVEQGRLQPVDFQAYQKGTLPRDNASSIVIFEKITPSRWVTSTYPSGFDFDTVPNAFSTASQISRIAHVAVESHFISDEDSMRKLAKGETSLEKREDWNKNVNDFLLNLIPFRSAIKNIAEGKIEEGLADAKLDVYGFIIPAAKAGSKISTVAATQGMKFMPKAMKSAWIATKTVVVNANPLDGFGDLISSTFNAAGRLSSAAYRGLQHGVGQLVDLFGATKTVDHADLLKRADIAEGVIKNTDVTGQPSTISALFKDGNWYAFDVARNRPYGPPLENFSPDSAVALERTTFSDGTSALTPSRLFTDNAHTIQRSSGVDVVVGDKVYRIDPQHPESMVDITSPTYFKDLEGFDAICSRGGKSKRTADCLAKTIEVTANPDVKRSQAVEHKVLYPTAGTNPKIVHERRIYTCDLATMKCVPTPQATPLAFKTTTKASIIDNPYFGLRERAVDATLNTQTRVVKFDGIADGIDDARTVRAFLVDIPGMLYGKSTYLVAEVDTGLFYYSRYDSTSINDIVFTKLDYDNSGVANELITKYHGLKDPILIAAGVKINRDFVALPTLDTLYQMLVKEANYKPAQLDALEKKVALLPKEKQREFVVEVWNNQRIREIEVIIPAIKIEPIRKPPGFDKFGEATKNRLLASGAKEQLERQIAVTGIGPANQRVTGDSTDFIRQSIARPLVMWEYTRMGAPNAAEMILKTGGGNCDQMAGVTATIINAKDPDKAAVWHMTGHVFTVVGGPPKGTVATTVDFSESAFLDAVIFDSWLDIICPANEYIATVESRMKMWHFEGRKIITSHGVKPDIITQWMDPTDPIWVARLTEHKSQI
jgi:hypothetical protein